MVFKGNANFWLLGARRPSLVFEGRFTRCLRAETNGAKNRRVKIFWFFVSAADSGKGDWNRSSPVWKALRVLETGSPSWTISQ